MRFLRLSTEITLPIGPFLDKTDAVTEETGLAGTATEIRKAGGSFGAGPNLGTHDADGYYPITLTTTHTNTLGEFTVKCHDSVTHLPVFETFMVMPAAAWDALFAASGGVLPANVTQSLGTASGVPTTAAIAAAVAAQTDVAAALATVSKLNTMIISE